MRAPRPTLLIYNAEDDCCFRAPLVKPYVFDDVKRFFKLYGKEDAFEWHENRDPGTHNYQLDNRQQSYRFFTKVFHLAPLEHEIPVDAEVNTYEELVVGLPKDNLTILGLAKERARAIHREPLGAPASEREKLAAVVRYKPVTVKHAWAVANTKNKGVETLAFQFQLSNDLAAAGVLVKAISAPATAPATIVLNDKGRKAAAERSFRARQPRRAGAGARPAVPRRGLARKIPARRNTRSCSRPSATGRWACRRRS